MLSLLPSTPNTIAERILDAFPSGSYALVGLLRLLDIVETESIPTAAVECRVQPRMLINPEFVKTHAATPEKLLVLVMHELHHVLLGHTTLFPRTTPVQNFVFDAVINGIVCRMFPHPEYTTFFSDYYSSERFPECLLRPPPGWPDSSDQTVPALLELSEDQRVKVQEVHSALYSETGASYHEVFSVLPKVLEESGSEDAINQGTGMITKVPLLGSHDDGAIPDGQLDQYAPLLFDIVRDLVEQWPQPPDPIRGRSLADVLASTPVCPKKEPSNRAILRRLIRKVAGLTESGRIRRQREDQSETVTPIPALSRRSIVLQALGAQPLLHPGTVAWKRRISTGEQVRVYIDVSGSMGNVLRALYGAVLDCHELVFPTVHLFSTRIADVSLAELKSGKCLSTGGTDIGCVADHMARHRVSRALLITDGWVGRPHGQHLNTLARSRLAVAYLGGNINQSDLELVAKHTSILNTGV